MSREMIELVIKMPKVVYERFVTHEETQKDEARIANEIRNGIPLPKGHGRLIDADKTIATAWTNFYKHEDEWEKKDNDYLPIGRMYDQNGFECCQQTIVNAPTVIEADKVAR